MAFSDLVAQPGECHGIVGTTRAGKSCFIDWEAREIQASRPDCMQIIVDTKPRFRAETERMPLNFRARRNAAWRYEHWSKGPVVPGSVLVDIHSEHPFRGLWTRPGEIAIMQSGEYEDWILMLDLLKAFAKAHISGRERRAVVDEVLDFYGRTTHSISNKRDVFYLIARSGGERMIGESIGSQRLYGLPILIRNMIRRYTLYYDSEEKDVGYLAQNGVPSASSPQEAHVFKQWVKEPGGKFGAPFTGKLDLPEEYLSQLAAA